MSSSPSQWLLIRIVSIACLGAMLILEGGCEKAPASKPPVSATPVLGDGVIEGRVTFVGTPPELKPIDNSICHPGANPITEESIVVTNGGLENTFVYLEGGPRFAGAGRDAALLDQKDCRYVPHVLGLQIGQSLQIRSSDPTIHNVHFMPDNNASGNFGMTQAGEEKTVTFDNADIIRFKCDVHPWMTAYVGVFDNPFFAVSAKDGTFKIDKVPDGSYKLVAWQEMLGTIKRDVVLKDGKPIEVNFEFKPPQDQG
jgi:plastocyanin